MNSTLDFDVIVIGAGVAGVGAACHLQRDLPGLRIAVLERRAEVGGTWDLFRYPGIRSDSDMLTFGYAFSPWNQPNVLADGPSIRSYVKQTAERYGVLPLIHFGQQVKTANYDSASARWTLNSKNAQGEMQTWRSQYVLFCTGYYDADHPYRPEFTGEKDFAGSIIHPQQWPENIDLKHKKVVIIGSGATAITLLPTLADAGVDVTMLQRSPGYVLSIPSMDPAAKSLMRHLPSAVQYRINRARNIRLQQWLYRNALKHPKAARKILLNLVKRQLHGKVDMRHFTPSYNPWEQRLCVVPDGDLFRVLREGKAKIVTDSIKTFTADGITLASGEQLKADVVISATGLTVQMFAGIAITLDGTPYQISDHVLYKATLVDGLPNAGMVFGYTNASWTLKADIASTYICRVIKHMKTHGYQEFRPVAPQGIAENDSIMGSLQAGYVQRAQAQMPRQGRDGVWRITHNYISDSEMLLKTPIADDSLIMRKVAAR